MLRSAVNGDEVWSEWEHRGTRRDGSAHVMRGVVIFGVGNGLLTWARFYLEPVQEGGENVDAAVRRQVAAAGPPPDGVVNGAAVILVAGGSGRLGTLIVRRLAARGLRVRVLTRDRRRTAHLEGSRVEVIEGDVRDARQPGRWRWRAWAPSCLRFMGSATSDNVSPASVDRDGNRNLIDAAAAANAAVVLMSIVGASAEHPIELFRMKHAAEEHLRASGAPWTIVRATAFAEFWLDLLDQTAGASGRPVIFGRGANPINFVSVSDVAALAERAVVDPSARGATFEIGGPQNVSFNELAAGLQRASGRTAPPRHVPRTILRAARRGARTDPAESCTSDACGDCDGHHRI